MNDREFAGAKWWKFDFHTHTPTSDDFTQSGVTPKSWLKAFMDEGIDCVAITDHNSDDWIDDLKGELEKIENDPPPWYQPLYLFPGVEITAYGDVHILAIFGREKHGSDIDQLLGAVGYSGTKGKSDAVTKMGVTDVVNSILERGGIPIPAHANGDKGLFRLQATTLKTVLEKSNIYAMEIRDTNSPRPQLYTDAKLRWTEVNGSDTHNFSDTAFGTFTWIKMDEPSIDGLELALIDGDASVNRDMAANPNQLPAYFVEKLTIRDAKYIGRSKPLSCRFSPFLNAIIGGRGSGKSTLMEFMRLTLRRNKEIPEPLRNDNHKYYNVGGRDDLLIENTAISLIYRKGEVRYRLNWSNKADLSPLEEEKNGHWQPCPGEIDTLFPVYLYSQRQIFELASNPRALINIIDEAPEVDFRRNQAHHVALVNRYKQIGAIQRELDQKIAHENRLQGESNDLQRQIEQIEKSGHEAVLQNYSKRRRQLSEIESLEGKWKEMRHRLEAMRDDIAPAHFNKQHFVADADILLALEKTNYRWQTVQDQLGALVREAQLIIDDWSVEKTSADWHQQLRADMADYESLSSEMEQQDFDPQDYPRLLTQRRSLRTELQQIGEYRERREELEHEKTQVYAQIKTNRAALSQNRTDFLARVLHANSSVSIEGERYGQHWDGDDGIENEVRTILQCEDRFDKDIDALKEIYLRDEDEKIENLKSAVMIVRDGKKDAKDNRFARHLENLPEESMNDLALWFPKDNLKVTFGPKNQRIEQGSPGQKTAALLAFILSYGDEPLLLDQPEDDLDNALIYKLVVDQIRGTKSQRQVIVVTHNANIVVNGDAEMVLPLEVGGGETHVSRAASIQEKKVREAICDILEGGLYAFEQRYKRVHLGD